MPEYGFAATSVVGPLVLSEKVNWAILNVVDMNYRKHVEAGLVPAGLPYQIIAGPVQDLGKNRYVHPFGWYFMDESPGA